MATSQGVQQTEQTLVQRTMGPIHSGGIETELQSIADLGNKIRTQEVSPVEIVSACLGRIEQLNPELNAFITVLADQALEQAKIAEAEIKASQWRGPLHGIPVGIKDFYDTAGIRTTAGFGLFKDRVPAKDAVGVASLKEAGAIVIGKMNMHRLGMGTTGIDSDFGPACNPWNAEYIPGGSSSGSAAAVATGMCYATLDTDAIGSCRLPAACCGVVGFKGSYGLINPKGILEGEKDPGPVIRWFSHPGIMTRTVEDTALVLDVLAGKRESTVNQYFGTLTSNRELRIGVGNNFEADREVSETFERAVEIIRGLGYPMKSVAIPFGNPWGGLDHIEADRKSIAEQAFKDVDVLLLPTTTTTVPTVKDAGANPQALSPQNTVFANYYGLPAISVPCGFDNKGLPLGLQMVAKPWGDASVLQLGYHYQTTAKP
jgi:aspartyl-tRNA(Asn)/glutamyl-tRNA(Gln) amidotransferase subunit A